MKTEVLERFGIPKEVIKRWNSDGIRQLLPIQIQSVNRFGILDGNSLIIAGPGTSGKTFCGEMAALRTASLREKAVFLVPLKAIAIEKYKTFNDRYSPLGLKIRLSTRDHTDHEKDISKNRFDILISIYEKLNSLTSNDITLIKSCRCFILDEFQMISDPQRGAELELIISKIRRFNPDAQVVILMGGGTSPQSISEWLNIPILEETRRPVDLRLGVLFRGTFHFRGFNNHDEGDEKWLRELEQRSDSSLDPQVLSAIKLFAERGEQSIIFTSTKRSAVGLARYLGKSLDLQPAKKAISGLDDLPPSVLNEFLGECFYGGTGFHHAELDQDQRELVESGFRSGEVKILVSTSTLAWGVNLPAKNVFIESMKYSGFGACNCRETLVPLSTVDFSQAAGRAGRIGYNKDYGRAILTAKSPFENEVLWENYIYGAQTAVTPGLSEIQIPEFLVRLISCGAADTRQNAEDLILDSCFSKLAEDLDHISKVTSMTIEYLEKCELIRHRIEGRLNVTDLGNILSSSGFSAGSIVDMHDKTAANTFHQIYDWLYYCFNLPEWRDNCGNYFLNNVSSDDLIQRLNELSSGAVEHSDYLGRIFSDSQNQTIDRRLFEMLFALEWISGRSTRDLETLFNRGAGGLRQDARLLCWILNTISKVINIADNSNGGMKGISYDLASLAARMKHGLPDDRIPLAETYALDREFANRLWDFGIRDIEDIEKADFSFLNEILPPGITTQIFQKTRQLDKESKPGAEIMPDKNMDNLTFMNDRGRLRRELKIDGKSIMLQPKLYSYFQKLIWGVKSGNPWVSKENLERGINQPKYLSKLRRILKENNVDVKIISDGAGHYRLLLPERSN